MTTCEVMILTKCCFLHCLVTSVGLRELGKLESLQELYLSNNLAVDDNVLAALGQGCKKLRYVGLGYLQPWGGVVRN